MKITHFDKGKNDLWYRHWNRKLTSPTDLNNCVKIKPHKCKALKP